MIYTESSSSFGAIEHFSVNILQQKMDPLSLAALTFSFLVASICYWSWLLRNSKNTPSLPPGPKGLPLFGSLFSVEHERQIYLSNLAQRYGPIFKLKLGKKIDIVITSPSIAKEVLKDQDITFANRDLPLAGREATYDGHDISWTPYGDEWRMLRKICVRDMLSTKTLDSVYDLRRREVRQTIKYFYEKAGKRVNVGEQMLLTVLNVITGMMWGGAVKGEERTSVGTEFKQIIGEMTALLGKPNMSDYLPGLSRFDLQGIRRKMKVTATRFDKIFDTIIGERLRNVGGSEDGDGGKESKDVLEVLLKLKEEGNAKTQLSMTHLKALLMDMVIGGTDTTSNTVEFALAEMMNKPETLKKAQQELESAIGKDNIVEETDTNKLPYLHAVMKETLRLHPALPFLLPHCSNKTSQVAGYTIPNGSRVFINVWAIHRDPSIWENPLEFCPERFLDGKWDYSGNDFNYFPFGSGRRICVGTAMSERMFLYSLASLVHSFDWKIPDGEKLELTEKFGIVLKKREPLVAIPTPRLPNSSLYE